jgi:hypothetical protein
VRESGKGNVHLETGEQNKHHLHRGHQNQHTQEIMNWPK